METENDNLLAFLNEEEIQSNQSFRLARVLACIYVTMSWLGFIGSLWINNVPVSIFLQNMFAFTFVFVQRIFPFVAFVLFACKKKVGWVAMVGVGIINIMMQIMYLFYWVREWSTVKNHGINILSINLVVSVLVLCYVVVLLFRRPIVRFFNISVQEKWSTVIISVSMFVFLKFYLLSWMLRHVIKSH